MDILFRCLEIKNKWQQNNESNMDYNKYKKKWSWIQENVKDFFSGK